LRKKQQSNGVCWRRNEKGSCRTLPTFGSVEGERERERVREIVGMVREERRRRGEERERERAREKSERERERRESLGERERERARARERERDSLRREKERAERESTAEHDIFIIRVVSSLLVSSHLISPHLIPPQMLLEEIEQSKQVFDLSVRTVRVVQFARIESSQFGFVGEIALTFHCVLEML